MSITQEHLRELAKTAKRRPDLWAKFITRADARRVAEVGVFRGGFAEKLLNRCPEISTYYMIDPWRHLENWNKPANKDSQTFEDIFAEAMARTESHARRRIVLRGTTSEVAHKVSDGDLDFVYIDGDHTLRGITIDLIQMFGKVRPQGWIGGDDFARSIWQHGQSFEPTMVFPFAVYFAEAVGCPLYALPFGQFLIEKAPQRRFSFTDLTDSYPGTDLLGQLRKGRRGQERRQAETQQA